MHIFHIYAQQQKYPHTHTHAYPCLVTVAVLEGSKQVIETFQAVGALAG